MRGAIRGWLWRRAGKLKRAPGGGLWGSLAAGGGSSSSKKPSPRCREAGTAEG